MINRLRSLRCRLLHSRISWPTNGQYECQTCFLKFPVDWKIERKPKVLTGIEKEFAAIRELERMAGL